MRLEHGAGSRETMKLVKDLIVRKVPEDLRYVVGGSGLDRLDDGAVIRLGNQYLVVSTDSFTVDPIFFPGGDIGHLAACGVINDLVMMGAEPLAFMDSIVVEEGFPLSDLDTIIESLISVLRSEGVALVGGDFKVMPKGSIDRVVITGTGLGITEKPLNDEVKAGDKLIVVSPIAEHGSVVLAAQLGLEDELKGLKSDSRPLTKSVLPVIRKFRDYIHAARDPTRGGVAAVLNEWGESSGLTIVIERGKVPIRDEVRSFLDALGIDPLTVACEGSAVLAVDQAYVDEVVQELRRLGESYASVVGEVINPPTDFLKGKVVAITEVGGKVLLEPKPLNLPRIC